MNSDAASSSGSTCVTTALDAFFNSCLDENIEEPGLAWGEDSGLSVSDVENLARPSANASSQSEEPERDVPLAVVLVVMANRQRTWLQIVSNQQSNPSYEMSCDTAALGLPHADNMVPTTTMEPSSSISDQLVALNTAFAQRGARVPAWQWSTVSESSTAMYNYPRVALDVVQHCSRRVMLKEDQAEVCPICLEEMRKTQQVKTLPCSHSLHGWCCTRFFRTPGVKPVCPVCRFDMAPLM
jgi:hypothetical protein